MAAVAAQIDAGSGPGSLVLLAGGSPVSTITLRKPCSTINAGVLYPSGSGRLAA